MIYIKYIDKKDPTRWAIYAHKEDETIEYLIKDSHHIWPSRSTFDIYLDKRYYIIKYLTEQEVDLLKLELL